MLPHEPMPSETAKQSIAKPTANNKIDQSSMITCDGM